MNQVAQFENQRWTTTPQKREFRHDAALSLIEKGTVLDVGCGDGLMLTLLKEKGIQAEGVDISEVAVDLCRKKGFQAEVADFSVAALPYADASFDTVLALDVLEHVLAPEHLLKEMLRVSREQVVIGVPNFSSLPARLQVLRGDVPENNLPHKGHVYWFTLDVLRKLITGRGARITELRGNVQGQQSLLAPLMRALGRVRPSLFYLSFVVRIEKHD